MTSIWKWIFIVLTSGLFLVVYATSTQVDNKLHLVICNVGQGDGILIYQKSTQIVIDAGSDNKILACLNKHMPFWDREIELAILTNPDLDHYGGFSEIIRRYKVNLFESPGIIKNDHAFKILQNEISKNKIENKVLAKGDKLKLGNVYLESQWPTREYLSEYPTFTNKNLGDEQVLGASNESVNKWSEVTLLTYGSFKALLTGDIQNPATDDVANNNIGPVSVLKVPHHGSKNGLTEKLLNAVSPKIALISAGEKNRYGHPHQEILKMLESFGVKTLCTCEVGEIEIITDGKTWEVVGD